MSEQHTKGTLIVGEVGDRGSLILADSERMSLLTIVDEDGTDFVAFYNPADAIRLAACWNACNGISTEHLENLAGGPEHGVTAYAMDSVTRQRDELLDERSKVGLAIDAAIRDGVVPEQHPLRSRLEMLANHRQREQDLLAALAAVTDHFAKVMGGPMISGQGVTFANGVDGIPTIKRARELIANTKAE